jgi:hypothetical protein
MTINAMVIGYDVDDRFTMEHFPLHQRVTLTTKIYCSRLYIASIVFQYLYIILYSMIFFVSFYKMQHLYFDTMLCF